MDDIDRVMRRMMRRMFGSSRSFEPEMPEFREFRTPKTDIRDEGNELIIDVEMPGVDKGDIDLNLTHDRLSISAERKTGREEEDEGTYLRERSYSSFKRAMTLPVEVNPNKAKARFERGVLHIEVPKAKPSGEGRRIEIE